VRGRVEGRSVSPLPCTLAPPLTFGPIALLACLLLFGFSPRGHAQHSHVNAGAPGSAAGAQLYFATGDGFSTNSGYVVNLTKVETGPYAGYHHGAISFTALPSTGDFGGPALNHAAPGAHLELRVISASGPAGGEFAFWESDGESDATALTFGVPVGETAGTNQFRLSETDGSPGVDPYGHIHGRKFTATLPGLYTVGFQILDTSANGANGGPLHPPSELFALHFQAGVTIATITPGSEAISLKFATQTGQTYFVEMSTDLASPTSWQTVAGPLAGNNHLLTVAGLPATTNAAWFRLRVE
jgi:hypothetical protein